MIKNIVFDIGNVLLNFNPREYMKTLQFDDKTIDALDTILFKSQLWIEADRGTFSIRDLVEILVKENPHYKKEIRKLLSKNWVKIHTRKEDSIDFLKTLKNQGFHIYLLSNCSQEAHDFIIKYDFAELIDGGIYSYELNICKPEKEIYEKLIEKFDIHPKESIFIDDNQINVEVSCELGFHGIAFTQLDDVKQRVLELISSK